MPKSDQKRPKATRSDHPREHGPSPAPRRISKPAVHQAMHIIGLAFKNCCAVEEPILTENAAADEISAFQCGC